MPAVVTAPTLAARWLGYRRVALRARDAGETPLKDSIRMAMRVNCRSEKRLHASTAGNGANKPMAVATRVSGNAGPAVAKVIRRRSGAGR